eukprot:4655469-Amphidinium_carterae.1
MASDSAHNRLDSEHISHLIPQNAWRSIVISVLRLLPFASKLRSQLFGYYPYMGTLCRYCQNTRLIRV